MDDLFSAREPSEGTRSESFQDRPLGSVFAALFNSRQSGELQVFHRSDCKILTILGGRLVGADSNCFRDRFESHLFEQGLLSSSAYSSLIRTEVPRSELQARLMKNSSLDQQTWNSVERRWLRELALNLFQWNDGETRFVDTAVERQIDGPAISLLELIQDGLKRCTTSQIESWFGSEDSVPRHVPGASDLVSTLPLDREIWHTYSLLDGQLSIKSLRNLSGLGTRELYQHLALLRFFGGIVVHGEGQDDVPFVLAPRPSRDSTVLVVDDDPKLRSTYEATFRSRGYRVILANDGGDGILKCRATLPQFVVLDLMMPKMHGFDFMRILRNSPETEQIPIIVISSLRDEQYVRKALQIGADLFLLKPLRHATLEFALDYLSTHADASLSVWNPPFSI